MSPPRFVIAQVGRTGSGYTAALFTAAGIITGHERYFNPLGERDEDLVGDSSWCSAPELPAFAGLVFHQTREPLATLRSLLEEGIGTHSDSPYVRLRHRLIGGTTGDPLADAVRVWVVINATAEGWACRRWRVEDLDADIIFDVAGRLDLELDPAKVDAALAATPRDTNAHAGTYADLGWDDFPPGPWLDRLRGQAHHYGYPDA